MTIKILNFDLETAPNTAHVWGLFKQNIGINQIIATGRVMCFAAKWLDKSQVHFYSEFKDGHEATIRAAHALIEEADAILSYNGERFDLPTLNKEFIKYGLPPPSPYHHIDLLKVAKRRFRFTSNKMDHLAKELGLKGKVRHPGHEMWIDCMNGDPAAWRLMERYNKQDVKVLEKIYEKMLPWIDTHPNAALYLDHEASSPTCTNCGSTHVVQRGYQRNKSHAYKRLHCDDCGTWMRSRYSVTKKNTNVLTQVGG
jgi:DNA polymerase elongation subunit (family B)